MVTALLTVKYLIRCNSEDALRKARETALSLIQPDVRITRTFVTFSENIELREVRLFRVGDYFDDITMDPIDSLTSRLVFQVSQKADMYWKDILVQILRSIGCAICDSVERAPDIIELRIAQIAGIYQMTADEIRRLCNILKEWPKDLWEQGINEEQENILAARELSQLRSLSIEYFEELQCKYICVESDQEWTKIPDDDPDES